MVFDRI